MIETQKSVIILKSACDSIKGGVMPPCGQSYVVWNTAAPHPTWQPGSWAYHAWWIVCLMKLDFNGKKVLVIYILWHSYVPNIEDLKTKYTEHEVWSYWWMVRECITLALPPLLMPYLPSYSPGMLISLCCTLWMCTLGVGGLPLTGECLLSHVPYLVTNFCYYEMMYCWANIWIFYLFVQCRCLVWWRLIYELNLLSKGRQSRSLRCINSGIRFYIYFPLSSSDQWVVKCCLMLYVAWDTKVMVISHITGLPRYSRYLWISRETENLDVTVAQHNRSLSTTSSKPYMMGDERPQI